MSGVTVPVPVVCVVTRGRGETGSEERQRLIARLVTAARAGANMVQVRERNFDDRALAAFLAELIAALRPEGTRVIVNERTDIALTTGADGVHLKSDAPPAGAIRRIVPPGFMIGRSVHSDAEAVGAERAGGCDYLTFGTVFRSSSKVEDHPVAGLEALRHTCAAVSLPVVAIGGIVPSRAEEVRRAGAAGVAAISLFAEAQDIAAVTAALRGALTLPTGSV